MKMPGGNNFSKAGLSTGNPMMYCVEDGNADDANGAADGKASSSPMASAAAAAGPSGDVHHRQPTNKVLRSLLR